MDHTTNRTFICSVVFVDIVDYSQQPVDEQIRLKNRFNGILAEAIKDVAVNDRIILDTGDGAAISFLGDPEDALFVALNIRDTIIGERNSSAKPRLSACIGINLGPVKLVKDINGQRNLIGDGINVAQRVMSFAKPGQILVSRSYYEVISRLSQEYAKLFHYEGSRADKHVREHQVYSVYPVEKEKKPSTAVPIQREEEQGYANGEVSTADADTDKGEQNGKTVATDGVRPSSRQLSWNKLFGSWDMRVLGDWVSKRFGMLCSWISARLNMNTLRNNRAMLTAAAAVIVILIAVPVIVWKTGKAPATKPEAVLSPASVAAPEITKKSETPVKARKVETPVVAKKAETHMKTVKVEVPAAAEQAETSAKTQRAETTVKVQAAEIPPPVSDQKKTEMTTTIEKPAAPSAVSLGIAPWGEVFLDGQKKGVSPPLNKLQMTPGKHTIEIRNSTFPPYKQTIDLKPGEQLKIMHKFL